jgi:hypothetical protein
MDLKGSQPTLKKNNRIQNHSVPCITKDAASRNFNAKTYKCIGSQCKVYFLQWSLVKRVGIPKFYVKDMTQSLRRRNNYGQLSIIMGSHPWIKSTVNRKHSKEKYSVFTEHVQTFSFSLSPKQCSMTTIYTACE